MQCTISRPTAISHQKCLSDKIPQNSNKQAITLCTWNHDYEDDSYTISGNHALLWWPYQVDCHKVAAMCMCRPHTNLYGNHMCSTSASANF